MDQSERNPNQESDRSRAPGHPSIDRADELREKSRTRPHDEPQDEKGRDEPPENTERDPNDPWMGGG